MLLDELKAHDWYYEYSDDGSVWRRGTAEAGRLYEILKKLGCPYKWWDIHKAIFNMVVEDFTEVEPNKYYRNGEKYKCVAAAKREDLLTRAEATEILEWINVHSGCM